MSEKTCGKRKFAADAGPAAPVRARRRPADEDSIEDATRDSELPAVAPPLPLKKPTSRGHALVGSRVRVFWPPEEQWYSGTVAAYLADLSPEEGGEYRVAYDDGDIRMELLEELEFLDTRPPQTTSTSSVKAHPRPPKRRKNASADAASRDSAPPSSGSATSDDNTPLIASSELSPQRPTPIVASSELSPQRPAPLAAASELLSPQQPQSEENTQTEAEAEAAPTCEGPRCELFTGGLMVLCSGWSCQHGPWFHPECVGLTQASIPEGAWRCPSCVGTHVVAGSDSSGEDEVEGHMHPVERSKLQRTLSPVETSADGTHVVAGSDSSGEDDVEGHGQPVERPKLQGTLFPVETSVDGTHFVVGSDSCGEDEGVRFGQPVERSETDGVLPAVEFPSDATAAVALSSDNEIELSVGDGLRLGVPDGDVVVLDGVGELLEGSRGPAEESDSAADISIARHQQSDAPRDEDRDTEDSSGEDSGDERTRDFPSRNSQPYKVVMAMIDLGADKYHRIVEVTRRCKERYPGLPAKAVGQVLARQRNRYFRARGVASNARRNVGSEYRLRKQFQHGEDDADADVTGEEQQVSLAPRTAFSTPARASLNSVGASPTHCASSNLGGTADAVRQTGNQLWDRVTREVDGILNTCQPQDNAALLKLGEKFPEEILGR
jgi:hypothetical protein